MTQLVKKEKSGTRPSRSGSMKGYFIHTYREMPKWVPYLSFWILFPLALFLFYPAPQNTEKTSIGADVHIYPKPRRISRYDEVIRKHASTHKVDWRLIASIIYAESSFKKDAVSPAGAEGLMQIMPAVANEHGVTLPHHPEENIRAGVSHFVKIHRRVRGATKQDAVALSLAAYNVGLGHLRDAQRLALNMNLNHRKWRDVRQALSLLENPIYYESSKYGYARGSETIEYVDRVMKQYGRYKVIYPAYPLQAKADVSHNSEFDA